MAPRQKPGKSRQDYQTPPELLRAIEREFHVEQWDVDLAADAETAIAIDNGEDETTGKSFGAPRAAYLGVGSAICEDALACDWSSLPGNGWLNPPFAKIAPWAQKCEATVRQGRIFLLVPASVGSNWYQDHVHGKAHVVALSPRVTFVGEKHPYPKDLILPIYSNVVGGFSSWRWRP